MPVVRRSSAGVDSAGSEGFGDSLRAGRHCAVRPSELRRRGIEAMFSSVLVPFLIGISQGFWYLLCTNEARMHPPGTQRHARLDFARSYCRIKRCSGLLWKTGLGVHSPGQEAREILDVFYNCGQCILAETF